MKIIKSQKEIKNLNFLNYFKLAGKSIQIPYSILSQIDSLSGFLEEKLKHKINLKDKKAERLWLTLPNLEKIWIEFGWFPFDNLGASLKDNSIAIKTNLIYPKEYIKSFLVHEITHILDEKLKKDDRLFKTKGIKTEYLHPVEREKYFKQRHEVEAYLQEFLFFIENEIKSVKDHSKKMGFIRNLIKSLKIYNLKDFFNMFYNQDPVFLEAVRIWSTSNNITKSVKIKIFNKLIQIYNIYKT